MIRAVVGSGGKTSLIKKLASEYRQQGKKVLVTTTTHMFLEPDADVSDDAEQIIKKMEKDGCVMAGTTDGHKFTGLSFDVYEKVCRYADEVLIEADGSKRLPFKFPAEYEPVIYENVDEIIVVTGLHKAGGKAGELVHRLPLAQNVMDIKEDDIVTPEVIQKLLRKGYLEPLREKYPDKKITIYPAHTGTEYEKAIAEFLKNDINVSELKL